MDKEKLKFIAEYCGWKVNDFGDTLVLECQSGEEPCRYDGRHKMKPVVYFVTAALDSFYDTIRKEAENFDASSFAFAAAKQYFDRYKDVPPLITICDFAKDVSARLDCLDSILSDNIFLDDFEKKTDSASSSCGFQLVIARKSTSDLFAFQNGNERFLSSFRTVSIDDSEHCQYPDEEKRISRILDDIAGDIIFSSQDSERWKKGDALIRALSAEFGVSASEKTAEKFL